MMVQDDMSTWCDGWLAAWTGGRVDAVLAWYTDDCAYVDPSCPAGLFGTGSVRLHLAPLLRRFPDWQFRRRLIWRGDWSIDVFWRMHFPMRDGMDRNGLARLVLRDGLIAQQESAFGLDGLGLPAASGLMNGQGMRFARPSWDDDS